MSSQSCWDDVACNSIVEELARSLDQHRLACLHSAAVSQSGSWLDAFLVTNLGTKLDDEYIRIRLALCLGVNICEMHCCKCMESVDVMGIHPLPYKRSAGRIPRHSALNNVILQVLEAAGFPSMLEPMGLNRGDRKSPDGMTTFPYSYGKSLVWDAICVNTFSRSRMIISALSPGSAATLAEQAKMEKYSTIGKDFRFVPVVLETSGVAGLIMTTF